MTSVKTRLLLSSYDSPSEVSPANQSCRRNWCRQFGQTNHLSIFKKIMFPTTASKNDLTKAAREHLMDYINMVQSINETAVLY
jgi:hypothetical protein